MPGPTAQALWEEVAATPVREPEVGLGTTVHDAPFQCSIIPFSPTAHALHEEIAATAASRGPGAGGWNPVQATQFEEAALAARRPADRAVAAAAARPPVLFPA
jgi:hypothetical protein